MQHAPPDKGICDSRRMHQSQSCRVLTPCLLFTSWWMDGCDASKCISQQFFLTLTVQRHGQNIILYPKWCNGIPIKAVAVVADGISTMTSAVQHALHRRIRNLFISWCAFASKCIPQQLFVLTQTVQHHDQFIILFLKWHDGILIKAALGFSKSYFQ